MASVLDNKIVFVEPVQDYVDFGLLRAEFEGEDMDIEEGYSYSSRIVSIGAPFPHKNKKVNDSRGNYASPLCQWEALTEWPESP